MFHLGEIRELMQTHMNPNNIYSTKEIYRIIEESGKLDTEDLEPDYPNSQKPRPKWTRNVRNCFRVDKKNGYLIQIGRGYYKLNIKTDTKNVINQEYSKELGNIEQTERETIINQRIGQQIIRKHLLVEYENKCAMCNIDHADLLRVSHIIPWSENKETRLDVQNTLLLCGLHDLAFEKGFITIKDDYTIIINTEVKGVKTILESITSKVLLLPKSKSYYPKHEYLKVHQDKFRSMS